MKNTGIGNGVPDDSKVKIIIDSPNQITIHHGWTEMGQGVFTMAVQFLCESTGVDPDFVKVKVDTSKEAPCGMTTASRGTSLIGNSVLDAGKKLKADLKKRPLEELVGKEYTYYENGQVMWEASYVDGKLVGKWIHYDEDGNIADEDIYENGVCVEMCD